MVDLVPLAVLFEPPETTDITPVAEFEQPPNTEAQVPETTLP
jgi:hypothetical protein